MKFQCGHPMEAPNTSGIEDVGDVRPIARYISGTVQDRDIVSTAVACDLSNSTISNDLE